MRLRATVVLLAMATTIVLCQEGRVIRFAAYDIVINSKGKELAAYQVEVSYDPKVVAVTGVEGGEKAPFSPGEAPYYDPKGLTQGKIVVAAFTTSRGQLPTTTFRVARLHLQVKGKAQPDLKIRLIVAGTRGAKRIDATAAINPTNKGDAK